LGGGLFICFLCCVFLAKQDRKRLTMEINYELDDTIKEVYDKFLTYFSDAAKSNKIWQIIHSQSTHDWKRNAGAGKLVNRVSVRGIYTNKRPASYFKTNVQIPSLQLKGTELYFFPERLVVKKSGQFAAVFYKNLNIDKHSSRFIEEEGVPSDAQIVDYTWKFVNKNGGPDRRFNNNRQLPICYYSYYSFTSSSGIYETICTSRNGAFDNFSQFVTAIGQFQRKMQLN
ncbi:MAG: hypothetical protein J7502_06575, partial [Flavisolibacter sp.]|nr:hypothetical protein [Flavisolibacter sp.]